MLREGLSGPTPAKGTLPRLRAVSRLAGLPLTLSLLFPREHAWVGGEPEALGHVAPHARPVGSLHLVTKPSRSIHFKRQLYYTLKSDAA